MLCPTLKAASTVSAAQKKPADYISRRPLRPQAAAQKAVAALKISTANRS